MAQCGWRSLTWPEGDPEIDRTDVSRGRLILIACALALVVLALFVDLTHRNDKIGIDFHTYLAAAQVGLENGWPRIYDQGIVSVEQHELVAGMRTQPYLSPPTVAWVTAPLASLPYNAAYAAWALLAFVTFAAALVWSGVGTGAVRWIGVFGALSPWWVIHSVDVGQVTPFIAAAVVLAWKLLRDRRDVEAGIVLVTILLKPNTAVLVPVALLVAGRHRAFLAWAGGAAAVMLLVFLTLGAHGVSMYASQLRGPLPGGADNLTLHGAFEVTGISATVARLVIAGSVVGTAYRRRAQGPELFMPAAIIGSLLISPYLHASDLCLLSAAGWMVWEQTSAFAMRAALAMIWVLASPYLYLMKVGPHLNQWPLLEVALLIGLAVLAWAPLTSLVDSRRRAPA